MDEMQRLVLSSQVFAADGLMTVDDVVDLLVRETAIADGIPEYHWPAMVDRVRQALAAPDLPAVLDRVQHGGTGDWVIIDDLTPLEPATAEPASPPTVQPAPEPSEPLADRLADLMQGYLASGMCERPLDAADLAAASVAADRLPGAGARTHEVLVDIAIQAWISHTVAC